VVEVGVAIGVVSTVDDSVLDTGVAEVTLSNKVLEPVGVAELLLVVVPPGVSEADGDSTTSESSTRYNKEPQPSPSNLPDPSPMAPEPSSKPPYSSRVLLRYALVHGASSFFTPT
jgi:hypothetical protein